MLKIDLFRKEVILIITVSNDKAYLVRSLRYLLTYFTIRPSDLLFILSNSITIIRRLVTDTLRNTLKKLRYIKYYLDYSFKRGTTI